MEFERARTKEQKAIRIEEITVATLKLFKTTPYDKITLAAIGKQLSFTRVNLYKYVKSKEEVFLHIILRDVVALADDLEKTMDIRWDKSKEKHIKAWVKTFTRHERLLELISILNNFIEKNATVEALTAFKPPFMAQIGRISNLSKQAFGLDDEKAELFFNIQTIFVNGLYPRTKLSKNQIEAMKRANIDYEPLDFETAFKQFLTIILKGL